MDAVQQTDLGKMRLDCALVRLGLFETREQAQRALLAGELVIDGRRDAKPGIPVRLEDSAEGPRLIRNRQVLDLQVRNKLPFVSRGGLKLVEALDAFAIDPRGMVALDIGASTGGFTDCLLQRGAVKVYAVDCGTGQLHAKLRGDARVVVMEKTNARYITRAEVPEAPDIVVADVSFISLRLLLPVMQALGKPGAVVVLLVKPQFEVGPENVCRGGVVRDEAARRAAVDGIRAAMTALGWDLLGEVESPVLGPAGNHEYLLAARMQRTQEHER